MNDNKICRCCAESLPDLDCDNIYRCFIKNTCVNGDNTCLRFRPIQMNNLSFFDRITYRIKEIFVK